MSFRDLVQILLDDDHGISETAYHAIFKYAREHNEFDVIRLLMLAKSTDGRFYTE